MAKILTTVGLLDPTGKLTDVARIKFVTEVLSLLQNGNADGKGMKNPITAFVPLPITDPTKDKLFYFGPDEFIATIAKTLPDKKACPMYHKIWIDGMFEKIAQALDLEGGAVAPPVMDPTLLFPNIKLPNPIKLPILNPADFPNFMAELLAVPDVPKFIAELTAKIPTVIPPFPTFPKIPTIEMPEIPGFPAADLVLPKITIELVTTVFPKVFVPSFLIDIVTKLPDLPAGIFKPMFNLVFDILADILGKIPIPPSPKCLMATLLVMVKNITVMLLVDVLGLAIGVGGICKLVAQVLGLL